MTSPGPIPAGALEHHVAFLGKTGSGKSNGAKVIVEDALDAGERVCVIDPTGAWWGLRLRRDGKPSKYPVVIFGGLHADVPLDSETVAAAQKSRAKAGAEAGPVDKGPVEPVSRPAGGRSPVSGRGPAGVAAASEGSTLTGPQRHLLEALAWWAAMGHDAPTRTQLAAKAGWTPKGSNLRNRLSELSQLGLVEYPRTGTVKLTAAGSAVAPAPDTAETLIESIRAVLTGPQLTIFDVLLEYAGQPLTRTSLAERIGWEPGGSNLRNRLSELSQLELVEYPAKGEVQLQEWVQ